ncbi:E3 ubiquitin-protein ligase RSL1-like protein [Drosera capensis]
MGPPAAKRIQCTRAVGFGIVCGEKVSRVGLGEDLNRWFCFMGIFVWEIIDVLCLRLSGGEEPDDIDVIADLLEDEIAQWQQSCSDHNYSIEEQRPQFDDLRRPIHDRRFAVEIERIPDQEWINTGDEYQRPYGEGSSKESGGEVTGKNKNLDENTAKWVERIHLCQNNFTSCTPFLIAVANNDNYAFKLASDAITSQMNKPANNDLKESCFICLEEFVLPKMFTVDACGHLCCNSCMKKHLEVKLAQGKVPKCPNAGCEIDIKANSCGKLLGPKMHHIMSQLVKEASIPLTEKVYCPDPRCSTLMLRSEVLEFSNARAGDVAELGGCFCIKCQKAFCICCNVPWHTGMTCFSYKKVKPDPDAADTKLKSLATTKKWRQCPSAGI